MRLATFFEDFFLDEVFLDLDAGFFLDGDLRFGFLAPPVAGMIDQSSNIEMYMIKEKVNIKINPLLNLCLLNFYIILQVIYHSEE